VDSDFQKRIPTRLGRFSRPFMPRDVRTVAKRRKLLAARILSPRLGMSSSFRSISGNRVLRTSVGARSRSSTSTHRPSLTAVVRTPGLHWKLPGLESVEYKPMSIFASVCSFRCNVTMLEYMPSWRATSWIKAVLPTPGRPCRRTGSDSRSMEARFSRFLVVVAVITRLDGSPMGPCGRGRRVLPYDTTYGVTLCTWVAASMLSSSCVTSLRNATTALARSFS